MSRKELGHEYCLLETLEAQARKYSPPLVRAPQFYLYPLPLLAHKQVFLTQLVRFPLPACFPST